MEKIIKVNNLSVGFGRQHVLHNVNMPIYKGKVTAIIGPSGCGKSTFLRCLNRMNDIYDNFKFSGKVLFENENIFSKETDVIELRRRIGMVFQKPNPFPSSIYENVAFGLRIQNINKKSVLDEVIEKSLKKAALWDEVKDRLSTSALRLSGGQQQRLCIARTIAVKSEVILFDEPCSALDPTSTRKIEDLLLDLKKNYTIIIVTHNMHQAKRISDYTGFFHLGDLIEFDHTEKIFNGAGEKLTRDYVRGDFG
jgi:phosphate transport system ATP-binding protein